MVEEENRTSIGQPEGRTWGRFANRTRGNTPWKPKDSKPSTGPPTSQPKSGPSNEQSSHKQKPQTYTRTNGSKMGGPHSSMPRPRRNPLTAEEMAELRAENRCFNCRKPGHNSRNCPDRHNLRPPTAVASNAVSLTDLDRLAKHVRQMDGIMSNAVGVPISDQLDETRDRYWLTADEDTTIEYITALWMSAYDASESASKGVPHSERFEVSADNNGNLEVYDRMNTAFTYWVSRVQLTDSNFDVRDVVDLATREWETTGDASRPTPRDEYWLTADDDETCELVRALWMSQYDTLETIETGMSPLDRFEVASDYNGNFEVYDRLDTRMSYLVSREQLADEDFCVSDVVDAALAEWNSHSELVHMGYQGTEPDEHFPARYWLLRRAIDILVDMMPEIEKEVREQVRVWPCEGGYLICDEIEGLDYFVAHNEVRSPTFDIEAILARGPTDFPPPLVSIKARRRRVKAMIESNSVGVSTRRGRGRKQPKPTADTHTENLERSSATVNNVNRKVPRPIIVDVKVNGCPTRALIDSGSTTDFISTRLVDQLKLQRTDLDKPLPIQMTVQGSVSRVYCSTKVDFQYQGIDSKRTFDITNIGSQSYELILGTPFIFQHKVVVGLNPTRVFVGSESPLPMVGEGVVELLSSAADVVEDNLDHIRAQLLSEIQDMCKPESEIELPPFRAINHRIHIIDKEKQYPF
ncbi:hypothetical protein PM082_014593 [Marasmius tenuissimus]|nr:hypothetical protein PM082_014593 [Marasmius tenuissimus]